MANLISPDRLLLLIFLRATLIAQAGACGMAYEMTCAMIYRKSKAWFPYDRPDRPSRLKIGPSDRIASSSIRTIGAIVKICKRLYGNHSRMTRTIEAIQTYPKMHQLF